MQVKKLKLTTLLKRRINEVVNSGKHVLVVGCSPKDNFFHTVDRSKIVFSLEMVESVPGDCGLVVLVRRKDFRRRSSLSFFGIVLDRYMSGERFLKISNGLDILLLESGVVVKKKKEPQSPTIVAATNVPPEVPVSEPIAPSNDFLRALNVTIGRSDGRMVDITTLQEIIRKHQPGLKVRGLVDAGVLVKANVGSLVGSSFYRLATNQVDELAKPKLPPVKKEASRPRRRERSMSEILADARAEIKAINKKYGLGHGAKRAKRS